MGTHENAVDVIDLVRDLLRDPLIFPLGLQSNLMPHLFMPCFHHHHCLDFLKVKAEHPQPFLSLEGPTFLVLYLCLENIYFFL